MSVRPTASRARLLPRPSAPGPAPARAATALAALAAGLVLLTACGGGWFPAPVVAPSPPPDTTGDGLRAGLARVDITPPPGAGLMGYGPEGKRARGWRTRLYARALVLEDGSGERVGLVTAELGAVSALLHREVAARVRDSTGLGPDRLILSATHTHAGPGAHFGHPSYDQLGTAVPGFDPRMVAFLADRIAEAVLRADAAMAEARAAWGTAAVWELTKNRSMAPFDRNEAAWRNRFPKPLGSLASGRVDSTLALLRVDIRDPDDGAFRPAGAFTVFAIHGTGIPSANRLYDADIHGIAARALEAHIDAINGEPGAVGLIANGAEGDVAPDLPADTRCQVPFLARVRRPTGPRTPPGPMLWIPPEPADQAGCLRRAKAGTLHLGAGLGRAAIALFDSLDGQPSGELTIRRAFHVLDLRGSLQVPDGCHPQPGVATLGGAEDGYTRYRRWRWLGVVDVGFAEDSAVSARARPEGCHGMKRPFLGRLQRLAASRLLPEMAQITVLGLGDMLLVTLPFEATTVVGGQIREAALDAAADRRAFDQALLVGLTNGYNQYVATEAEYALQHYEGASTLYGPRTGAILAATAGLLARQLPPPGRPSPEPRVPPLRFYRAADAAILPPDDAGPPLAAIDPRTPAAAWEGDTLVVRWTGLYPGRRVPADGPVLEIRYDADGGTTIIADGDPSVEVWERGRAGDGWRWEARWTPARRPEGPVEVVLVAGRGLSRAAVRVRDRDRVRVRDRGQKKGQGKGEGERGRHVAGGAIMTKVALELDVDTRKGSPCESTTTERALPPGRSGSSSSVSACSSGGRATAGRTPRPGRPGTTRSRW